MNFSILDERHLAFDKRWEPYQNDTHPQGQAIELFGSRIIAYQAHLIYSILIRLTAWVLCYLRCTAIAFLSLFSDAVATVTV